MTVGDLGQDDTCEICPTLSRNKRQEWGNRSRMTTVELYVLIGIPKTAFAASSMASDNVGCA